MHDLLTKILVSKIKMSVKADDAKVQGQASIAAFVIVCSPPTIIGILSAATSSDQTEVTLFKVSWLSSTVSKSPISCTGTFSRSTSDRILYSSRFADTSRMAPGPKRDPALYVLLRS